MKTKEEKEQLIKENKDLFDRQLTYVKVDLLKNPNSTFITSRVFKDPITFRPDLPTPTAAANGKEIFIDPECWENSKREERLGIVFHEGYHNMMMHCDFKARTKTEKTVWNLAVDCNTEAVRVISFIGEQIKEAAIKPDDNGNVRLKINKVSLLLARCHEKTSQELYDLIMYHIEKNPPPEGTPPDEPIIEDENGNGIGPMDDHDLKEFSPEEKADAEQQLRQAIVEHKLRGTMPKGVAEAIERMLKGSINWRAELREMIVPEIKTFATFRKRNRRGQSLGLNIPGAVKEGVRATVVWDTSGSIGKEEIKLMTGNTTQLFKQFDPGTVHITMMFHTSEVYQILEVDGENDMEDIKIQSGGTCHLDVFKKAEEMGTEVLICFTDGYSEFPEETNIKKVLWIVTDENGMDRIPDHLGKKIHVPIKDLTD